MGRSLAIVGLALILLLSSCYSAPTPIIIRPIPELTMDITSDDSSVSAKLDAGHEQSACLGYIRESSKMVVKLGAYIEELVNQIKNKVPYIDLRKGREK